MLRSGRGGFKTIGKVLKASARHRLTFAMKSARAVLRLLLGLRCCTMVLLMHSVRFVLYSRCPFDDELSSSSQVRDGCPDGKRGCTTAIKLELRCEECSSTTKISIEIQARDCCAGHVICNICVLLQFFIFTNFKGSFYHHLQKFAVRNVRPNFILILNIRSEVYTEPATIRINSF